MNKQGFGKEEDLMVVKQMYNLIVQHHLSFKNISYTL